MATSELERPGVALPDALWRRKSTDVSASHYYAAQVVAALSSLRLTVVLFAAAIFLVFVGTLAQVDNDIWEVVRHTYFRVWIAEVKFQAFDRLGQMFYKPFTLGLPVDASFPFPGGKLIGVALLVNLLAAHAVRFKVVARGARLAGGLAVVALGLFMTYLVILSGGDQAIESELSPAFANGIWLAVRTVMAGLALFGLYGLVAWHRTLSNIKWWAFLGFEALVATAAVWLLIDPYAWFDQSGMRIMWQLVKGMGPGLVLLAGCFLLFKKRAGVVLLHGGVALMMLSEILTAMGAHESQMAIPEGASVNWSYDIRSGELAVTDRSANDVDRVTVVPQSLLAANVDQNTPIENADLPFKIRVRQWMPNSKLVPIAASEKPVATAGFGLQDAARELRGTTGVEMTSSVDVASAYIELVSKKTGDSLGTYLVSQNYSRDQPIEVDGKKYDVALRFERTYHPFSVHLKDFAKQDYVGTDTPKSYESLVQLTDPERNVDREVKIWMNNPLRYAGVTFYQADFDKQTEATTVLQIVKNPSWMAPYVGCMFVLIGMVAHFGLTLSRFLERQSQDSSSASPLQRSADHGANVATNGRAHKQIRDAGPKQHSGRNWAIIVPVVAVVIFGGYLLGKARMPKTSPGEMQIYEFGKLPVQYQGRVKPYDTVARNTLQYFSGRQEVIHEGADGKKHRTPAIRWLLDTISGSLAADDHRVFRIDNPEVLDTLGLAPRTGSFRYSVKDFRDKIMELAKQAQLAAAVPEKERSLYQRRVIELAEKLQLYGMLQRAFSRPVLTKDDPQKAMQELQQVRFDSQRIAEAKLPLAIPPLEADAHWVGLMEASAVADISRHFKQPFNEGALQLGGLLDAYQKGDASEFNRQLKEFERTLSRYEQKIAANESKLRDAGTKHSEILSQARVDFEAFFNNFSPFYYCAVLYLVAFMFGAASWLGWSIPLRRASLWLLCFTFAVHTFALASRLYISGRPPVTNLYSSAVFIGWGAVLLTLILEFIFKLGLANIIAAVIGFLTLVVAHFLSLDGDTLIVMQAVLDTQFWLATHVVCITLGYATTFVAGAFGIAYILLGHVFPVLNENDRRQVTRMTYGTLCFAILFSFIGTVLGGLWADDSWGRFWGWDPKENGALIIVLYNALVLHARWGGLVKGRGLANLVIGGNIVTTWSWFGVNELGVGLHAYGASESSTAMWLLTFVVTQLVLVVLGMMPARWFGRSTSVQMLSR